MNRKEALQAFLAGASGSNPYAEGSEARKTASLQAYLAPKVAGQKQEAENAANLKTLQSPELQSQVRQGGSVKAGDISVGADPYAHMAAQGPHQALNFQKVAQKAYAGINDQLDAAQSTIDLLNQKNAASDKLALINEARLAAGMGGSRAIKGIMDAISGGKTVGMDFQNAMNYVSNMPQVPTMQDTYRNALRETVYGRIPQMEKMHQQASQQLSQQGPVIAPQTDYATLTSSYVTPAAQKIQLLKQRQMEYQAERAKAGGGPTSNPSVADPNETLLDKIANAFRGRSQPQIQAAPKTDQIHQQSAAPQAPQDDAADFQNFYTNVWSKMKGGQANNGK